MTDWCSAVGMLRRLASVWRSASTFFGAFGQAGRFATSDHPLDNRRRFGEHTVELLRDLRLELALHLVNVCQLRKYPSPERLQVVHTRHPVRVHRQLLVLRILAPVALR